MALSFLELAEEDCFGHAYIFHPCDMTRWPRGLGDVHRPQTWDLPTAELKCIGSCSHARSQEPDKLS